MQNMKAIYFHECSYLKHYSLEALSAVMFATVDFFVIRNN